MTVSSANRNPLRLVPRLAKLTCGAVWLLAMLVVAPSSELAQQVVWQGDVSSNGSTTQALTLRQGVTYSIVVSGDVYFGRWSQNGRSLLNDACYEFNAKGAPDPLPVFKNNLNIPVCDGNYRSDHVYRSAPFAGGGQLLTFSIFDTDYRDNGGALSVQVIGTEDTQPPPEQMSGELLGSWLGCDGRVVTFTLENGQYFGRYDNIGGLGSYGFQVGEIGFRAQRRPDGTYVGDVKWRWANGDFQWRENTITIKGDEYSDTASDSCSNRMTRL